MEVKELIQKLRDDGHKVWSYSRLGSFHNCNFEYYNSYIKKNRGIGNAYTEIGSFCHQYVEEVYKGEKVDTSDFNQKLHDKLFELELMDLDFPSEVIKNSFVKDMNHFTNNFNKLDGDFEIEKIFVTQFGNHYLMGFIDALRTTEDDNGNVKTEVVDWKCSSRFSGTKKLQDSGRQLVIYKLGLEQTSDIKIDEIKWAMLKYVYICNKLKNGKTKKKMVNRGKIIKEMKNTFEKEMIKSGMDEIEVGLALMTAESTNSFEGLPTLITDKYWIEDCFVEYEATDEVIKEVEEYVVNTIEEIESKDIHNESEWEPVNFDKEGTFYCNTLCNHRATCPFIKEYNKANPYKKNF